MTTLRIPAAIAASVAAFAFASTSYADDTTMSSSTVSTAQSTTATPVTPGTTTSTTSSVPTTTTAVGAAPPVSPAQSTTPIAPDANQGPTATTSTTTTTQGYYAPTEDRIQERTENHYPNRPLLGTGAGIFVLSYAPAVIVGAQSDRDADHRLYIPVVGPWLDMGQRHCDAANPCGSNENVAKGFIAASGAFQGIGVITALVSLMVPEHKEVQYTSTSTAKAEEKPEWHVLPFSLQGGGGVGAAGRF